MIPVIGVDCGLTGAIALLDGQHLIDVTDMPTAGGTVSPYLLTEIINDWDRTHQLHGWAVVAHIEIPGPMPKQGISSTWKFARSVGVVEGVLAGCGIPAQHHSPATWKRNLRLSKDKGASRALAARLWPTHTARFARVKDDGRAEAALIALHGTGWRP